MTVNYFGLDESFLRNLPGDPVSGARRILDHVCDQDQDFFREVVALDRVKAFVGAIQFYRAYCLKYSLECQIEEPGKTEDAEAVSHYLFTQLQNEQARVHRIDNQQTYEKASAESAEYASRVLGTAFVYELSDGDLVRIQTLLNEIRDEVVKCESFSEDHRFRLLKRVESLQRELHKTMSNLDRFWGLFVEAGINMGRFGEAVKPLVDRITEIVDIIWRVQGRAEQLPSNQPLTLPRRQNDKLIEEK